MSGLFDTVEAALTLPATANPFHEKEAREAALAALSVLRVEHERLERECGELHADSLKFGGNLWQGRAAALTARVEQLERALTKYGRHEYGCMASPPLTGGGPIDAPQECTCGLDVALAGSSPARDVHTDSTRPPECGERDDECAHPSTSFDRSVCAAEEGDK